MDFNLTEEQKMLQETVRRYLRDKIAPKADEGELQSTVSVYCKLKESCDPLRSGLTGHARIECGLAPIAIVFTRRCLRRVRTEFWW